MKRVILGRDGMINRRPAFGITSPGEWQPLPGSLEAAVAIVDALLAEESA